MSFRRTVIILSSVFMILLCLFIVGLVFSPRGTTQRAAATLLFPGLKPQSVARIEISDSASRVVLTKSGAWTIDVSGKPYPASQQRADALIQAVASLTRGSLVTRNAQAAAGLGIGTQAGKSIALSDANGKTLCQIQVGKNGAGGQGFYLQAGKASEVWQTGQALSSSLTTDRAFWADLRILPQNATGDSVIRLSVSERTGKPFSWTSTRERDAQNKVSWTLAGVSPAKVQQAKLDAIANAVTGLTGSDFLTDPSQASSLASPAATVIVSFADNRTFTVLFGAKTAEGRYPCSLEQGQYAYLVPEWRAQQEILLSEEAITTGSR
ncbi:MAG: DUF4340 domain-containing protein [Spirochaetia bacterium]|jgi:hypothetical protein